MQTKKCSKCHIEKDISQFNKYRNKKWLMSWCKECNKKNQEKYIKTKNGVISIIYSHQRQTSKKRDHNLPNYTNLELREWCFSQTIFHKLYDEWVASGYKKELKPSIDRLDDYKPYTFDNIRITTWQENNKKAYQDKRNGRNNKQNRAVIQLDLNDNIIQEFHSIAEAERQTKICQTQIYKVCNKNKINKTAGGFKWKYKEQK